MIEISFFLIKFCLFFGGGGGGEGCLKIGTKFDRTILFVHVFE